MEQRAGGGGSWQEQGCGGRQVAGGGWRLGGGWRAALAVRCGLSECVPPLPPPRLAHHLRSIAYAMLCYAMPCHTMLRYAMVRFATLCYAMPCYAMHHLLARRDVVFDLLLAHNAVRDREGVPAIAQHSIA